MVNMWKCSCCGTEITTYDELENEVNADTHFDIESSYKDLFIEDDAVAENLGHRNVKMNRTVCESCFNQILNESPTLLKAFGFKIRVGNEMKIVY